VHIHVHAGPRVCFNCGGPGHVSRERPLPRKPCQPPPLPPLLPSRSPQYVRPGGEAGVGAGIPTFVDGVHVRGRLAELGPPTDETRSSVCEVWVDRWAEGWI
jgi:hypothetical protein